jgi:hypothetical protein
MLVSILLFAAAATGSIRSPLRKYRLVGAPSQGVSGTFSAACGNEKYTLECASNRGELKYENLVSVQGVPWAPRLVEQFNLADRSCMVYEGFSEGLADRVRDFGQIMELGLVMLDIVEELQTRYSLNHRVGVLSTWKLRRDSSLVLTDFVHTRNTMSDAKGQHRVSELRQLVLNLRNMIDFDPRFKSVKSSPSIDQLCPSINVCPLNLRELLSYVFEPETEPSRMYSVIRSKLVHGKALFDLAGNGDVNSLIPGVAQPLTNPVKTDGRKYYIVSSYSEGVFRAVSEAGEVVRLRCRHADSAAIGVPPITAEFVPKIFPEFIVKGRKDQVLCSEMSSFGHSLRSMAPLSYTQVVEIGLRMLFIVERIHLMLGIAHRNLVADSWAFADDQLMLVDDFKSTIAVADKDRSGYHRIMDLQQLVLTMRYLLDPKDIPYSIKKLGATVRVDKVRPRNGRCPESLTTLIKYVFSISPSNGEVPEGMYSKMYKAMLKYLKSSEGKIVTFGQINSPSKSYSIIGRLGHGWAGIVYLASSPSGERVAVKCRFDPELENDLGYAHLDRMRNEQWVPRAYESFVETGSQKACLVLELLGTDLDNYMRSLKRETRIALLARIGVKTLDAVQKLHQEYRLVHKDIHASNWMFRLEAPGQIDQLVLMDFDTVFPVERDSSGYHRILDIQAVVLSLRYFVDFDMRFFQAQKLKKRKTDDICPSTEFCPNGLREVIEFAFKVHPDNGAVPYGIYEGIRERLLAMNA